MNIHTVAPFLLMLLYTSTHYTLSTFAINSFKGKKTSAGPNCNYPTLPIFFSSENPDLSL